MMNNWTVSTQKNLTRKLWKEKYWAGCHMRLEVYNRLAVSILTVLISTLVLLA